MKAICLFLSILLSVGISVASGEFLPKTPGLHQLVFETEDGFGLRYTVSIPSALDAKSPVPLVLALHYGFDPNAPFPEYYGRGLLAGLALPGLGELGAVILAPDSHGMRWTEPKIRDAVLDLMDACLDEEVIDPDRTLVMGFSMGAEGTWHMVAEYSDYFDAAIPIAGPVPVDTLKKKDRIPVYVIHGSQDELVDAKVVSEAVSSLQKQGWKIQFKEVQGVKHHDTSAYVPALKATQPWILEQWGTSAKE